MSDRMAIVSQGYTVVKGNFNSNVRLFTQMFMNINGYILIKMHYPTSGLYRIARAYYDNTPLEYWSEINCHGLVISEQLNSCCTGADGIRLSGHISDANRNIDDILTDLYNHITLHWELNNRIYLNGCSLIEMRNMTIGKPEFVMSASESATFSTIENYSKNIHGAYTTYVFLVPEMADEVVNFDLFGRDDYDPTYVITSALATVYWTINN